MIEISDACCRQNSNLDSTRTLAHRHDGFSLDLHCEAFICLEGEDFQLSFAFSFRISFSSPVVYFVSFVIRGMSILLSLNLISQRRKKKLSKLLTNIILTQKKQGLKEGSGVKAPMAIILICLPSTFDFKILKFIRKKNGWFLFGS